MTRTASFLGFANVVMAATPILALLVAYVAPLAH
jgi:hypothetical protein